jgi:mannosyl-glycoprotein endo-beta-N-acetylglucosaminidase
MKGRLPRLLCPALAAGLFACSEPPPDEPVKELPPPEEPAIGPIGAFGEYVAPISAPLDSVAELAEWKAGSDDWNIASIPLQARPPADAPASPWVPEAQDPAIKLIHCHDMMGGYVATLDQRPQGVDNSTIYNFNYWQYVDTFVYFSHHRVTIPPPGWTNAAHRSGVRLLGTFITGTTDDEEVIDLVDEPSPGVFPMVDKMVDMAEYYGFDGWFFNIETKLPFMTPVCDTCDKLARFIGSLRGALQAKNPAAQVIWYDSVTVTGAVAYQNSLTDQNKLYFDNSDGLFTNYWWGTELAYPSPEKSAALAGDRRFDVYTGTDVFGRGTYGGGGFTTYLALNAITEAGTSAALFAPGWTYESATETKPFPPREDRLWTGVADTDCAPYHGVAETIKPRAVPSSLPFVTTFNQGQGPAFFLEGKKVSEKPWGNIGQVGVLPTWRRCPVAGAGVPFYSGLATDLAFDGPSSWWIGAPGAAAGDYSVSALYKAQIPIEKELTASYTVLAGGLDVAVALLLDDQSALLLGPPGAGALLGGVELGGSFQRVIMEPAATRASEAWETREFVLDASLKGKIIGSIGLVAFTPAGSAPPPTPVLWLGDLAIFNAASSAGPVKVEGLDVSDVVWSAPSGALAAGLTLAWSASPGARHYDVLQVAPNQPPRFLGRTFIPRFSVAPGTAAPFEGETLVRFAVQAAGDPGAPKGEPAVLALRWEAPQ